MHARMSSFLSFYFYNYVHVTSLYSLVNTTYLLWAKNFHEVYTFEYGQGIKGSNVS